MATHVATVQYTSPRSHILLKQTVLFTGLFTGLFTKTYVAVLSISEMTTPEVS